MFLNYQFTINLSDASTNCFFWSDENGYVIDMEISETYDDDIVEYKCASINEEIKCNILMWFLNEFDPYDIHNNDKILPVLQNNNETNNVCNQNICP